MGNGSKNEFGICCLINSNKKTKKGIKGEMTGKDWKRVEKSGTVIYICADLVAFIMGRFDNFALRISQIQCYFEIAHTNKILI